MAAQVASVLADLLKTKDRAQQVQASYKQNAEQRIAYQEKMALLNEMVTQKCKHDTMLVEDVIVVTLVAETKARKRYLTVPPRPPPTKASIVGGTTKSAEEAIAIYQEQIAALQIEIDYRTQLNSTEVDMDIIYRQAVDDILDVMDLYCSDRRVHRDIETYAAGGIAPSSPRKSKHDKKNLVTRILTAPLSPVKSMFPDTTKQQQRETMDSPSASADRSTHKILNEYHESPKMAFSKMTDKSSLLKTMMMAPNLMDEDGGQDNPERDQVDFDTGHDSEDNPVDNKQNKNASTRNCTSDQQGDDTETTDRKVDDFDDVNRFVNDPDSTETDRKDDDDDAGEVVTLEDHGEKDQEPMNVVDDNTANSDRDATPQQETVQAPASPPAKLETKKITENPPMQVDDAAPAAADAVMEGHDNEPLDPTKEPEVPATPTRLQTKKAKKSTVDDAPANMEEPAPAVAGAVPNKKKKLIKKSQGVAVEPPPPSSIDNVNEGPAAAAAAAAAAAPIKKKKKPVKASVATVSSEEEDVGAAAELAPAVLKKKKKKTVVSAGASDDDAPAEVAATKKKKKIKKDAQVVD